MRAIGGDRRQRVPRVGPRQGALQPRAVRDPADRRVVSASASSRPGRTSRSSRISAWRRPRSSACSSPSSSASAWSRRKSSAAASTACCAKPIHRYQLVLGKYAGLVADARRQRRDHGGSRSTPCSRYMAWGVRSDGAARLGRAGARSGAAQSDRPHPSSSCSLVTAIALFFSTFSTPMLSAAFTFGLFVVGHFSADLQNFDQVVDSPAAARLARGLYWVLPNLAPFDVRAQVVHGAAGPGRLRGADAPATRRSTSPCC